MISKNWEAKIIEEENYNRKSIGSFSDDDVNRILEPAFRLEEQVCVVCREDRSIAAFLSDLVAHTIDVVLADKSGHSELFPDYSLQHRALFRKWHTEQENIGRQLELPETLMGSLQQQVLSLGIHFTKGW